MHLSQHCPPPTPLLVSQRLSLKVKGSPLKTKALSRTKAKAFQFAKGIQSNITPPYATHNPELTGIKVIGSGENARETKKSRTYGTWTDVT